MIACARCGHENADDATFCAGCQTFLDWQPRTPASTDSDVEVSVRSLPAMVVPGQEASGEVQVRNVGRIVDEFAIQVVGPASGWTVVEPQVLRLFPRSGQSARIVFRPPRSPETAAGVTPFGVRITSTVRTDVTAAESGRISVASFDEWRAALAPEESRGAGEAAHRVEVRNQGNATLTVALTLTEQPPGIAIEGLPTSLTIAPGEEAGADVRLRAQGTLAPGAERRHPVEVLVESDTSAAQRLRGAFVQVGPAPQVEWYAQLSPTEARGEVGSEHRVQVMNRGNVPVAVSLSGRDPAAALSMDVSPPALTVGPGAIGEAVVRVRALQALAPGEETRLPFEIVAELPDRSQVRLAGGFVHVGPGAHVQWQADLVPLASRSDWGAEHRVAIRNTGNVAIALGVSAGETPRGLALDGLPASVTVAAGQIGEVRLWARGLDAVRAGEEQVRRFELVVATAGAPSVRLRGSFTQVGGEPKVRSQSCMGRIGLLAAMLLVLAGLAAYATQTITGSLEGPAFAITLVSLALLTAVILGMVALITGSVAIRRLAVAAASVVALAVLAALGIVAALVGNGTISLGV